MSRTFVLLPAAIAAAIMMSPVRAGATIFSGQPLTESPQRDIQELRDIQRELNEPAERRQHQVSIAAAAVMGGAMGFAGLFWWYRRRPPTDA